MREMEKREYAIGRTVFGDATAVKAAYEAFRVQEIDEERLAAEPFAPAKSSVSKMDVSSGSVELALAPYEIVLMDTDE